MNVGRFVSLAAMGLGRQVRTVRFDEHALQGQVGGDALGPLGVRIGQGPVEAEIEAHAQQFVRHFQAARIAVEDAAKALAVLAQDIQRIAMGFAVMDDDGHVEFDSQLDHVDEDGLLDIPGRFGPVIIQTDFADGKLIAQEFVHFVTSDAQPLIAYDDVFGSPSLDPTLSSRVNSESHTRLYLAAKNILKQLEHAIRLDDSEAQPLLSRLVAFLALYPVDLRLGVMKDMKAANPKVYACALDNDDFIDSYFAAFRSLR